MEHCHNTVHEDNAMLLRWEIRPGAEPYLNPLPSPVPVGGTGGAAVLSRVASSSSVTIVFSTSALSLAPGSSLM